MGVALGSTVVNVADLEALADFWTRALGVTAEAVDADFRVLRGGRTGPSCSGPGRR